MAQHYHLDPLTCHRDSLDAARRRRRPGGGHTAPAPQSCAHLGRVVARIPRNWLECGCGRIELHDCRHHAEVVTAVALDAKAAAALREPGMAWHRDDWTGRSCDRCPTWTRLSETRKAPVGAASAGLRWITRQQFLRDAQTLAGLIAYPIRGVAGVPRSGLRAAAIVADWLQCPLAELRRDGQLRWLDHGVRLDHLHHQFAAGPLVVIEDSCWTGRSLAESLRQAKRLRQLPTDTLTACLYLADGCPLLPDIYVHRYPKPYVLECHIFGSGFAERCGFDLDGVLCRNTTADDISDETRYTAFLQTAQPLSLVRPLPAGLICSARSHTRRDLTVDWLARHGVRYHDLKLAPWREIVTANHQTAAANWKATCFRRRADLRWFVESDADQARAIAKQAGKTTICYETGEVFGAHHTQEL